MAFTVTPPTTLDSKGNLQIHAQQGVQIDLAFTDGSGPVDMTGRDVFFEVTNDIRIPLVEGAEPHILVLEIVQGALNAVLGKVSQFVILDETDAIHELLWQGQVTVRGWV